MSNILALDNYKNKFVVYQLLFPNNKKYIGYSSDIKKRWSSSENYKSQQLVYRAINKYGWENIDKSILYTFDNSKDALLKEKELIEQHNLLNTNFGYNLVPGGGDPPHGEYQHLSDETKNKLKQIRSENTKKAWQNPEKAERIKKGMKEKFHQSRMEKTLEERKEIWGKHNLGRVPPNAKLIYQLNIKTGEILSTFVSAGAAARAVNGCSSNIQAVANGKRKTAYGFKWRWADE